MIILVIVPILLCGFGIVCEKTDRRGFFCAAAALCVFAVCGLSTLDGFNGDEGNRYSVLNMFVGDMSFSQLTTAEAPPAYMLIMKICMSYGADFIVFPIVVACIQSVIAAFAVYSCCETPYAGAAVLAACFLPVFFAGSSLFTAALICLAGSGFVRERRFFRLAAVILAAACFDTSALLLIPLYLIIAIPVPLVSALWSAVAAVLAVLFPDAVTAVTEALGSGLHTSADIPAGCAVIAVIAALLGLLIYPMYKNRGGSYEKLVNVLTCGACMTAAAAFDGRLSGVALMLMMMSAVPLAPEAYAIGSRFTGIVFPSEKGLSGKVFLAVCTVLITGVCAYFVYGCGFGTEAYETSIRTVLGQ
ncbi:MAG: EpsG family protein [Ruminiclostridium sp.]|nr:EpsG family protein [Ruminiclostridium sp.]